MDSGVNAATGRARMAQPLEREDKQGGRDQIRGHVQVICRRSDDVNALTAGQRGGGVLGLGHHALHFVIHVRSTPGGTF